MAGVFWEISYLKRDSYYNFTLGWWLVSKSKTESRGKGFLHPVYGKQHFWQLWQFEHSRNRKVCKWIFLRRMCSYRQRMLQGATLWIYFILSTNITWIIPKLLSPHVLYASVEPNQALGRLGVHSACIEHEYAEWANDFRILLTF